MGPSTIQLVAVSIDGHRKDFSHPIDYRALGASPDIGLTATV